MPNVNPCIRSLRSISTCWLVAVVLLSATVAISTRANGQIKQAESSKHTPAELIVRLQSDRFSIRQKAMFEIMESPEPVIPLIESSIEAADSDFRIRSLKILELVALDRMSSSSRSDLAFEAIRRISLSGNDTLSQRASQSSYDILLFRQYAAVQRLERLNAQVSYLSNLDNEKYPLASHLIIDEKWKGTRKDLDQVPHLFGLSNLELCHEQVDDELISRLDSVYTLTGIKLKKCSISDASIFHLSRIGSLNDLDVLYCRIGPGCLESLEKFKHLSSIRLIGTDIDPSYSTLLAQRLSATLDIRRGAFMGIRYDPTTPECRLTSLVPGSGAEQSGLRVGDEIIEFNRIPIKEYGDLTQLLREKATGDQAKVKVKRLGEELLFDVVMGEWE